MKDKKEKSVRPPAYALKDVIPQGFKVTLKGKEYVARVYNTNDQCYFEALYGAGFFNGLLATKPSEVLTEIAYRLLAYDEDGNQIPHVILDFPSVTVFKRIPPQETAKQELFQKVLLARGQALAPTNREAEEVVSPEGAGF